MAIESNKASMPESFFICQLIVVGRGVRFPHAGALTLLFYGSFLVGGLARANRGVEGHQQLLASGSLAR